MASRGGVTVEVIRDTNLKGLGELGRRLLSLDATVLVGVPAGATEADGTSLALVAAANEFGVPSKNIPERSFLRAGIRRSRGWLRRLNANSLKRVFNGAMTGDAALNLLGIAAAGKIKEEIIIGDFAQNAPATIKAKGSDKPLVDTAQLRQSITYVIDMGQSGIGIVR